MESDGYDLKWKNHVSEIFSEVQKLRSKDYFSDIIVHCGGRNFRAHKLILAASSTFFEKVLAGIPRDRSHVLVLAQTPPDMLECVLDFVYDGEVFVPADSLEKFMDAAENLGIRGLRKESKAKSPDEGSRVGAGGETRKRPAPASARPPSGQSTVQKSENPRSSLPGRRNGEENVVADPLSAKRAKISDPRNLSEALATPVMDDQDLVAPSTVVRMNRIAHEH